VHAVVDDDAVIGHIVLDYHQVIDGVPHVLYMVDVAYIVLVVA
jgi:hypothetical protein